MLAIAGGHTFGAAVRPVARARRAGVTLLEIMFALGLLVILALGFLYSAMNTVRLNKMTELEVSATNAIAAQLDSMIAASRDDKELANSNIPTNMILYIEKVYKATKDIPDYPIRIDLNTTTGVLLYEFPIAEPGHITGGIATADTNLKKSQYPLGLGVMEVYLKEDHVPEKFYTWNDLKKTGATETASPANNTFFAMDSDDDNTADFTPLFLNSKTAVGSADYLIKSLPVTVTIRYYGSTAALDNDKNTATPGFKEGYDGSIFSMSRDFVINHATFGF